MGDVEEKKLKSVLIKKCEMCHKTRVNPDGLCFCHKCMMKIAKKRRKQFLKEFKKRFLAAFDSKYKDR